MVKFVVKTITYVRITCTAPVHLLCAWNSVFRGGFRCANLASNRIGREASVQVRMPLCGVASYAGNPTPTQGTANE